MYSHTYSLVYASNRLVESTIARAAELASGDLNAAAREADAAFGAATSKRAKIDMEEAAREAGAGAGFSFAVRVHAMPSYATTYSPNDAM
jgi:hypothetical protein